MPSLLEDKIKEILLFKEGWDGEDGKPFKKEVTDKVLRAIPIIKQYIIEKIKVELSDPQILPSPDGCIDLLWKKENYLMLATVNAENNDCIYYAEFNKTIELEGKLSI